MQIRFQAVAALALATSTTAFCPAPVARPIGHSTTEIGLFGNNNDNEGSVNHLSKNMEKVALSLVTAAVISMAGVPPPADAATAAPPPTPMTKAEQKAAEKAAAKAAAANLSKEEKEKIDAKKNYDLAQNSLKEYEKILSTAKATESKATTQLASQQKTVEAMKKKLIATSDKLSAARNQKMPQSAIDELSRDQKSEKETLRLEEAKLGEYTKAAKNAEKELVNAEKSVATTKDAIANGKKRLEKAEKVYKDYTKKVQEQKKKEAQEAAKKKAAEEKAAAEKAKKLKELENETKRLESLKKATEKELEAKKKLLESEKK